MPKTLEVIVTSAEEAMEAEAGGADRLELVSDLASGGLTPERDVVEGVLRAVSIPVRVMLRHHANMFAGGSAEVAALEKDAAGLALWPLDGLVAGFLKDGLIDCPAFVRVLSAAPGLHFTFHRAFDELVDPLGAIELLKRFPQVDRILTSGGAGDWPRRKERLLEWQQAAGPSLRILVAAGICREAHAGLREAPELTEVHVGRAARRDQSTAAPVLRQAVRALRSALE